MKQLHRSDTVNGLLVVLLTLVTSCFALSAEYYVAPDGTSSGNGGITAPWDIRTGIGKVGAGDTLWVRGGVYKATLNVYQSGTAGNPIVIRGYERERAIIDGGSSGAAGTITIYGSYVWLWDLELMSSDPSRVSSQTGSFPTDIRRPSGAVTTSQFNPNPGCKFINLIVHDGFNGLGVWEQAYDAEVYGNIIYNNGWHAPGRGHGHGIYSQNNTSTKRIVDNIIFNQFSHGIHLYTQNGYLNNFYLEGNTIFNNGSAANSFARNLLIGGNRAQNPTVLNNYIYYTPSTAQGENNIGYVDGIGCNNLNASGNYIVGNTALKLVSCSNVTMNGNTFYGATAGFTASQFPNNTFHTSRPSGTRVFVRPNRYESGRAHITVYNWDLQNTAQVDVSSLGLAVGDSYEVRDVQNYFGPPVVTGVYNGGLVTIPMDSSSVAQPVGNAPFTIPHTSSEFGAFVFRRVTAQCNYSVFPTNPSFGLEGGTGSLSVSVTSGCAWSAQSSASWITLSGQSSGSGDGSLTYSVAVNSAPTSRAGTITVAGQTVTIAQAGDSVTLSSSIFQARQRSYQDISQAGNNVPLPPSKPVYLEAESGTLTGPMAVSSDATASQGKSVFSPIGHSGAVSFTLNIPVAGNYVIWGRVLASAPDRDSFFVSIDEGAEDIYDVAEQSWSDSWQWTRVNGRAEAAPLTLNPRVFSLSQGIHNLVFRVREPNTMLDQLLVTNDLGFVPGYIYMEAESGTLTDPMAAYSAVASQGKSIFSPIVNSGTVSQVRVSSLSE